jgi:hypothetical protein
VAPASGHLGNLGKVNTKQNNNKENNNKGENWNKTNRNHNFGIVFRVSNKKKTQVKQLTTSFYSKKKTNPSLSFNVFPYLYTKACYKYNSGHIQILLSNDVEMNPGPIQCKNNTNMVICT